MKPRDAERSKNFFALGLISWMYTRPLEPTVEWIAERFGSRPQVADANTRLQQAGVRRELRARLRRLADGRAHLEDPWTGASRSVPAAVVVDCGHRLPEESLYLAHPFTLRAGDCVAPRTVLEAVLEGRRLALEVCGLGPAPRIHASTGATA